ncbi:hypothetical protein SCAR479_08458 [Seiridium cardinale]|uniref:Uncharacterized protein n=1 Tax=Seiridium cardinale TaxID=138064 RepID=A0ABR2XM62_9PEZI
MVIQLSFLAWSHEYQSLSQALTQAIDDMLVESRTATSHKLNYVSLLGTVGACQQQTTGFSWAHHYAAIEDKIFKELKNSSSRERPAKRRKSRSGQAITHVHQQSASDRSLPYVILRGLVKSMDSIQRFPEDCIPQLSCDRGISSVVLWCYHILGISVLIRLSDALNHTTTGDQSNIDIDGFRWPIPDTLDRFEITCRLLVGSRFTKDYVAKAFFISSHGWSVFLDIMEASDPTDVASGTLHIKPGVPARDGIRKTRIIDGMTGFGIDAAQELLFNLEPRISFWPGLRLGSYRTSMRREIDKFLTWPAAAKFEDNTNFTYAVKHPEDECNASRIPERIFRCQDTWYFYVTGDGAARWPGLDNLDRLSLEGNDYPMVARGKGCCVQRAINVGNKQKTIIFNAAAMGKSKD